ncbi:MAG TPA: HD domain-containing phosphohydrolase [Gemmatimonadaceae bacterium]|nr:HD domain-containing phosphohydrolase [Gemmatimonadaceae bacterium]
MSDHSAADPASENCTVYYGPGTPPDAIDAQHWRPAAELFGREVGDEAAVLIVDSALLDQRGDLRMLPGRVILVAADEASQTALGNRAPISVIGVSDPTARRRVFDAACQLACARLAAFRALRRLALEKREARELRRIGTALMLERDLGALLKQIIVEGKRLTESDAGLILLVEPDPSNPRLLRAVVWDFDYLTRPGPMITTAIDDSTIVGHAVRTRRTIVVDDAYSLPPNAPFRQSTAFDSQFGYYRRSMLVVPMIDHLDRAVGVFLFLNRKSDPQARITNKEEADRFVLPYTKREVRLARALASEAAVSIENSRLYAEIESILDGVVKASVSAIDMRDPTTAGHSLRVATLTTGIAAAAERAGRGRYRNLRFTRQQMRELRYAGLLHDFGKVAVHEDVLVKAKKLPPLLSERVEARFKLIRRTMEMEYYKARATHQTARDQSQTELASQLEQLEHMRKVVMDANEPTIRPEPASPELAAIAARTFERADGRSATYLTPEELRFLQLPKGTLDDSERAKIESHVEETYRYLVNIPWTDDLRNIATYASGHHEKLDGSGYPRRLKGDEIPVQVRMITIADIFDALTASDRPYKRAVPADKALDIIRAEAKAGRLDEDLVNITIESQAYRRILEEDWRNL